jgi:hypothetical protein
MADLLRRRIALAALCVAVLAGPAWAGQWLPGDMHSHISPPDVPPTYVHAKSNLEGAIAAAKASGLKWLVITPHSMDQNDEKTGRLWAVEMSERLAKREARPDDPLVILGWECTQAWPGHLTVSFCDVSTVVKLPLGKMLEKIRDHGGLAIVAHPYDLPNLLDHNNRSWRPWTEPERGGQEFDPWLSGLEIRHPMSPAGQATQRWDQWIGREQRRIIGVGSTDDHVGVLYRTTWVYIEGDLTRDKLRDALKGGRVVVGGEASAGTLAVTSVSQTSSGPYLWGQLLTVTTSAGPGEALAARDQASISWTGSDGRLFVDGKLQTDARSPVEFKFDRGTFHWVRLEMGIRSYANPVYLNLPAEKSPPPLRPAEKKPPVGAQTSAQSAAPPTPQK